MKYTIEKRQGTTIQKKYRVRNKRNNICYYFYTLKGAENFIANQTWEPVENNE